MLAGLSLVVRALGKPDMALTLRICQCEFHLESLFQTAFRQIMEDLGQGQTVPCLFCAIWSAWATRC